MLPYNMKAILLYSFLLLSLSSISQELFPLTEPASNMAAKSIGIRLNNEFMPSATSSHNLTYAGSSNMFRTGIEAMVGISKKWMAHALVFSSNMHQQNFKFEGGGFYLKYRLYSIDNVQSHFRIALYGKGALVNNAIHSNEINLGGDNSGITTGVIFTQLLHKTALSASFGYIKGMSNIRPNILNDSASNVLNYSLSFGQLVLPLKYINYNQPNFNLYCEFLGKINTSTNQSYLDVAPALQCIINSVFRVDVVYKYQLFGNLSRLNTNTISLRLEYNFFNAYK